MIRLEGVSECSPRSSLDRCTLGLRRCTCRVALQGQAAQVTPEDPKLASSNPDAMRFNYPEGAVDLLLLEERHEQPEETEDGVRVLAGHP